MDTSNIYKIKNEMEKIHKRMTLLFKKKETMGLNDEEDRQLHYLNAELLILHEELIEAHMKTTMLVHLIDSKISDKIKKIQKLIPWSGGLVLRDEDFSNVLKADQQLNELQREYISKLLNEIHQDVLLNFQNFCGTLKGWIHCNDASKVFGNKDGDILDVLIYLDAIYKEFAELLGIKLQEVEVVWDEVDDRDDQAKKDR